MKDIFLKSLSRRERDVRDDSVVGDGRPIRAALQSPVPLVPDATDVPDAPDVPHDASAAAW